MDRQRGPAAGRPLRAAAPPPPSAGFLPKGARRAAAVALALAALAPADALAAEARGDRICAPRATLYEAPNGIPIGMIAGGRPVLVLKRTANGRWTRVRTTITARGWVRTSVLCDED